MIYIIFAYRIKLRYYKTNCYFLRIYYFFMTFNPRNILYPLNLDIPSSKAVNIFTDLNNEAAVDKSFELDSMS